MGLLLKRRNEKGEKIMDKKSIVIALLLAFIIGCGAATVAPQFVAPPVQAGLEVQKWDYFCFETRSNQISKKSKEAGRKGWEMAELSIVGSYNNMIACFKRPMK